MGLRVKHAARHRELVQAHVAERVLAAGFVSTPRTGRGASGPGPRPGLIDQPAGDGHSRATGAGAADATFPPHVWLAVTNTHIYAFAASHGDVGGLVGAWDRQGTAVRRAPRVTRTRLYLSFGGSAPPTAVDANRWPAGNHELVGLLLDPSRTT